MGYLVIYAFGVDEGVDTEVFENLVKVAEWLDQQREHCGQVTVVNEAPTIDSGGWTKPYFDGAMGVFITECSPQYPPED